jgi:hypothetical protein
METLIKLLQSLHEEWGAFSWVALGVILPAFIIAGVITLRWVLRGGLGSGSAQFFAEQRTIKQRPEKD